MAKDDDNLDRDDFAEWWGDITFIDEDENVYTSDEYDFGDRLWAIEYAYEHGWDLDDLMDALYYDNDDFWEYWRENYGGD